MSAPVPSRQGKEYAIFGRNKPAAVDQYIGDPGIAIALVNNPDIIASVRQAEAAGLDVRAVRAERLPTVSGGLAGDYANALAS